MLPLGKPLNFCSLRIGIIHTQFVSASLISTAESEYMGEGAFARNEGLSR